MTRFWTTRQLSSIVVLALVAPPLAAGIDAEPLATPAEERVETHPTLRWIQQNEPEHYALLAQGFPDVLQAYREGTEHNLVDRIDASLYEDIVIPGFPGPGAGASHAGTPDGEAAPFDGWHATGWDMARPLREALGIRQADAAVARETLPPPRNIYRELVPTCDNDNDGFTDAVVLDYQAPTFFSFWPTYQYGGGNWGRTEIRGINGTTGQSEYIHQNGVYLPMMIPTFGDLLRSDGGNIYLAPTRPGTPNPTYTTAPPDVLKVMSDVNGDDVCDFAAFGYEADWPMEYLTCSLLGVCILELTGTLRVHDGVHGGIIWSIPIDTTWTDIHRPLILGGYDRPYYESYEFPDYPTGWEVFTSPTGPKIAWKTTTVNYTEVHPGPVGVQQSHEFFVTERYRIFNASTGQVLKEAVVEHLPSPLQMTTWLTGVSDLGGDDEPEIVYDQKLHAVGGPVSTSNPAVAALRGELRALSTDTQHLWNPQGFYTPPHSGVGDNIPGNFEGFVEVYMWHHAAVNGDATGDGIDDVLGTYLTGPPPLKFPLSVDYKTHLGPVSGADGTLVWGPKTLEGGLLAEGQDIKLQGWGYARALEGDNGTGTQIVLGTSDVPTPSLPGEAFLLKENFITVFEGEDGTPTINWRDRYAVDSYLAFDLTVRHSRDGLGVADWSGDGLPDLVTPAVSVPVDSATQRLLGQLKHAYAIIDSRDGKTISDFESWGGIGTPLVCADEQTLVFVSGHGRRMDISRIHVKEGEEVWRRPYFNNPMPAAMTAGTELVFLDGACANNPDDGVIAGLNIGLYSLLRRFEIMPPIGRVDPALEPAAWMEPAIVGQAALEPSIDFIVVEPADLSLQQGISWAGLATVAGSVLGVAGSILRARRWGL